MRSRTRSRALIALGLAVSALLLFLTFRNVSLDGVAAELSSIRVGYLVATLAVMGGMFLLVSLRSKILVASVAPFRFADLLRSHLLAFAVNNVIPLRAGDVARVGYLAKRGGVAISSCIAIVLTERLLELFVLCVVLVAVLPLAVTDVPVGASLYIVVAICFFAIAVAAVVSRKPSLFVRAIVAVSRIAGRRASRWIEERATTFADGLSGLRQLRSVLALLLVSLCFFGLIMVNINLVAAAVGVRLPWYGAVVVVGFITLGVAVPSTPGNVGTYHFFAAAALTALGYEPAQATSFAIVMHAVAVVPFTLIATLVLWPDFIARKRQAADFSARSDAVDESE